MQSTCGLNVLKDAIFCVIYNGKSYIEVKEYSTLTSFIQLMCENLKLEFINE